MFYSCLLDYGVRSKIYHKNLIDTYNKYPYIFDPTYVLKNFLDSSDELLSIIKSSVHPRYPNVALNKWIKLSKNLSKYDNLKKKLELMNFMELENFIKEIGGYGQKTGGLLIRVISDAKIINDNKDLSFIPIDRHDIEISYLNNIVDKKNLTEEEIDELSSLLINTGHDLGIDASTVDKYLWDIGNTFCNKKDCINCPLNINCRTKMKESSNESNND